MSLDSKLLRALALLSATAACGKGDREATPPSEDQRADALEQLEVGLGTEQVFKGVSLVLPTDFRPAPDNDELFYVTEQPGRIQLIEGTPDDVRSVRVALDISERVLSGSTDSVTYEEGLYSIVFHPDFPRAREAFISYTGKNDPAGAAGEKNLAVFISRFTVRADGTIDADSEQVLIKVKKDRGNHNGGSLVFERKLIDGNMVETTNLFIGIGDGGKPGDPEQRGTNPATLLAKILKIDVSTADAERGKPYSIPADNPYRDDPRRCPEGVSQEELQTRGNCFLPEVWSWGHRNPWRLAVDPVTGDVFDSEVGQESFEEINRIRPGQHYGWSFKEGPRVLDASRIRDINEHLDASKGEGIVDPVAFYDPRVGRSITGGYVYRGTDEKLESFRGAYIFGDYVSGNLFAMFADDSSRETFSFALAGVTGAKIGSFGEDNAGNLYVLNTTANGQIYRVIPGPPPPDLNADIHFFLSRDGIGDEASGTEYYRGICAIIDDENRERCAGETAVPTLPDWEDLYYGDQNLKAALYFNRGDLGFWRDMTCTERIAPGIGGCAVTNWRTPESKGIFEALSDAERADPANRNLFDLGTVTMTIGKSGETRFYVYFPDVVDGEFVRTLSPIAILDSEGPKAVPQLCTPCHGGQYSGPDNPDMGAMFREFDPLILDNRPGVSEEQAQREFFELNDIVYGANDALIAAKESAGSSPDADEDLLNYIKLNRYIEYLYDLGEGQRPSEVEFREARTISDDAAVPESWSSETPENPALREAKIAMWKDFVGPYCQQCHRTNTLDFTNYEKFQPLGVVTGVNSELEAYLGVDGEEVGETLFEDFPLREDRLALEQDENEKKFAIKVSSRRRGKDFMPNSFQTRHELLQDTPALQSMREWLVQSTSPERPQVEVEFVFHTEVVTQPPRKNADGRVITEDLFVTGSLAQLGALSGETFDGLRKPEDELWDVTAGLKLSGESTPDGLIRWSGRVRLPLGARFRFKSYVMTNVAEQVRWQCAPGQQPGESLSGRDQEIVLARSFDSTDPARARDGLEIVRNGKDSDYAAHIRPDIDSAQNLTADDAFLTIEIGRPDQLQVIQEGHAIPHYENRFHPDGKPPFDGSTVGCRD